MNNRHSLVQLNLVLKLKSATPKKDRNGGNSILRKSPAKETLETESEALKVDRVESGSHGIDKFTSFALTKKNNDQFGKNSLKRKKSVKLTKDNEKSTIGFEEKQRIIKNEYLKLQESNSNRERN